MPVLLDKMATLHEQVCGIKIEGMGGKNHTYHVWHNIQVLWVWSNNWRGGINPFQTFTNTQFINESRLNQESVSLISPLIMNLHLLDD